MTALSPAPLIHARFDPDTRTISYLLADPVTRRAAVIDPVLDFDPASGAIATRSVDALLDEAGRLGLSVTMVLETHAHADHLSAARVVRARTGAWIGIGEHIGAVQAIFRPVFALDDMPTDGSDFDRLLADGDTIELGELTIRVLHVPGHTPADVAYLVADAAFVGDTLFMPDYGTARADFPGGDARTLYRSIRKVLALPDNTRLFLCHDYPTPTRTEPQWETTVGEQRRASVHIADGVDEDSFVAMREARDAGLPPPRLLLPSIQVNVRAGRLPPVHANGNRYLMMPLSLPPEAAAVLD